MKRKIIAACCVLAMLLPACGGGEAPARVSAGTAPETSGETSGEAVSFTDDLGRTVTIAEPPRRVAVLIGSFADIWCLAGGKDSLAAAAGDAWTQFDLGLGPEVADLGNVKDISVEQLFAVQPDLVIASGNTAADVALLDLLEEAGLTSAFFNVSAFEDYLRMLEICAQLTGHPENYQRYGADVQAQVEAARNRADGSAPTVLYVRASGSSCKVKNSRDNVLGEMLADLGCVNIADSETGLLENLSLEVIVEQDPDFIFAVVQGSANYDKAEALLNETLLSHPAWASLTAVREGRFYVMDQKLYNLKPNANWGTAYEQLADILYP